MASGQRINPISADSPQVSESVLHIRHLRFAYPGQDPLLDVAELDLAKGQSLLLQGPSGSGKSSLLGLIGGVLQAAEGTIEVCGQDWQQLPMRRRDRFRAEHIGVIFQLFNLVPYLNALDNTLLPLRFAPMRARRAGPDLTAWQRAAGNLLDALGLQASLWQRPAHALSIGQQQRVAAARALLGAPELILADEPTSALDPANRDRFLDLLLAQARAAGSAVLLVSHDPALAGPVDRQLSIETLSAGRAAA